VVPAQTRFPTGTVGIWQDAERLKNTGLSDGILGYKSEHCSLMLAMRRGRDIRTP